MRPRLLEHRPHGIDADVPRRGDGIQAFAVGQPRRHFRLGRCQAEQALQPPADAASEVVHRGQAEQREVGFSVEWGGGGEPGIVGGDNKGFGFGALAQAGGNQGLQLAPDGDLGRIIGPFVEEGGPRRTALFAGGGVGPGDDEVAIDDHQGQVELGGDVARAAGIPCPRSDAIEDHGLSTKPCPLLFLSG